MQSAKWLHPKLLCAALTFLSIAAHAAASYNVTYSLVIDRQGTQLSDFEIEKLADVIEYQFAIRPSLSSTTLILFESETTGVINASDTVSAIQSLPEFSDTNASQIIIEDAYEVESAVDIPTQTQVKRKLLFENTFDDNLFCSSLVDDIEDVESNDCEVTSVTEEASGLHVRFRIKNPEFTFEKTEVIKQTMMNATNQGAFASLKKNFFNGTDFESMETPKIMAKITIRILDKKPPTNQSVYARQKKDVKNRVESRIEKLVPQNSLPPSPPPSPPPPSPPPPPSLPYRKSGSGTRRIVCDA